MKNYNHVLLAVELNTASDESLIKKAKQVMEEFQARLTLVHAVEHIISYGPAYGVAAGADVEEMLLDSARKEMAALIAKSNLVPTEQLIKMGPARAVILDEAKRLNVDLIVVGSHGRHGIRLLLGSTANAVLHGAECDVLAVRLQE
jgi:universal stress protein A